MQDTPWPQEVALKVKIFLALACTLMCLFAVPKSTQGQELKGLREVDIVIEDLQPIEKNLGLTSESLRGEILVALNRDLPKLKVESHKLSFVYLTLATVETGNGVTTYVEVSLHRYVEIIGDDGGRYFTGATVWQKGSLLYGIQNGMASRIRDQISKYVTALAAQYYKDNP